MEEEDELALSRGIKELTKAFPSLVDQYIPIEKIGEGTFSVVYKAIDVHHQRYDNSEWSSDSLVPISSQPASFQSHARSPPSSSPPRYQETGKKRKRSGFIKAHVALKRIYVTSSPQRIANEIKIMTALKGHPSVAHLITALRNEDQVILVLPYFSHQDFRDFYLHATMNDVRYYIRSLLESLQYVHSKSIIHRDVKTSNFLYNKALKKGVLVDFGLAQFELGHGTKCKVQAGKMHREKLSDIPVLQNNFIEQHLPHQPPGYSIKDKRPAIKANRAGTRGFRAPEVLFKVVHQTTAIDIWSVGVILLCIFTKRFPFFNSCDDADAIIEMITLFGFKEVKEIALKQFRRVLNCNIPMLPQERTKWKDLFSRFSTGEESEPIPDQGYQLLDRMLCLDPNERITATEALSHPFLQIH